MSTRQALRTAQAKQPKKQPTKKAVSNAAVNAKVAAEEAVERLVKRAGNKGVRLAWARREQRAHDEWETKGRKGPEPARPNYDAIVAEYQARESGEMPKTNNTKVSGGRTRLDDDALRQEVGKAILKGYLTASAVVKYLREQPGKGTNDRRVRAAFDDVAAGKVHGFTKARIADALTVEDDEPVRKAPAKKAAAKKAPAKKAPAKKATGRGAAGKAARPRKAA